jgi:hypothetical protein
LLLLFFQIVDFAMPRIQKTAPYTLHEASKRADVAMAYLEAAASKIEGGELKDEDLSVVAGNAILAGIAASDAICGSRLGKIHRGDDHGQAVELLKSATPDGKTLSLKLARLLDVKDQAHYGIGMSLSKATDALKAARILVARARVETER